MKNKIRKMKFARRADDAIRYLYGAIDNVREARKMIELADAKFNVGAEFAVALDAVKKLCVAIESAKLVLQQQFVDGLPDGD